MTGFDNETKILSSEGWKNFDEVTENTLLVTLNKDLNTLQYQNFSHKNLDTYDGEMYKIFGNHIDLLITPFQKLYHSKNSKSAWIETEINSFHFGENRIGIRSAGSLNLEEYPIEDDIIKIVAWLITDGGIKRIGNYKSIAFYQRKEKIHLILDILNRLNIKFRYNERQRNITQICGKKLKQPPKISGEIFLSSEESEKLFKYIDDKHTLPKWVYDLSDRQFNIFLSSLVDGDGSRHKTCPGSSWMLYGVYKVVEQVQIACFLHNIRTTISTYRVKDKRLNISLNSNSIWICHFGDYTNIEKYSGILWNVKTENGTLVIKRNEKICIVSC